MTLQAEDQDKSGEELAGQRFQMLEDIAKELAGEIVFPTCFDVAMHLRKLLDNPDASVPQIASAISGDPLLSSKLLALANSAMYASDQKILDIKAAVSRLGLQIVRTVSLNTVMKQLLRSANLATFNELNHRLWKHSLQTAVACSVVARQMTRINPDTAFLAGMVHDIGAFYMLYRAASYPELLKRPESLKHLVAHWHESIGISVLAALGMPEEIINATLEHDRLRPAPETPKTLGDLVYIGNILAGAHFEWLYMDIDNEQLQRFRPGPHYLELREQIEAQTTEITLIFS